MGWLTRVLRSPELIGALAGGAGGYLTADEGDDPLKRALAVAALGGAGGAGVSGLRGLLSRQPASKKEIQQAVIEMRRLAGANGSAATQFPSREFTDQLNRVAELKAGRAPVRLGDIGDAAKGIGGLGLLGGGAAYFSDQQSRQEHTKKAYDMLSALGYKPDQTGLIAFQSEHKSPITGSVDDDTFVKLSIAVQRAADGIPSAPSLRPDRR